jgi:hypothetical protein
MGYILLYVAIATAPVQMGAYASQQDCTNAIRAVYAASMAPVPQAQKIIDTTMLYQREYVCVNQGTKE